MKEFGPRIPPGNSAQGWLVPLSRQSGGSFPPPNSCGPSPCFPSPCRPSSSRGMSASPPQRRQLGGLGEGGSGPCPSRGGDGDRPSSWNITDPLPSGSDRESLGQAPCKCGIVGREATRPVPSGLGDRPQDVAAKRLEGAVRAASLGGSGGGPEVWIGQGGCGPPAHSRGWLSLILPAPPGARSWAKGNGRLQRDWEAPGNRWEGTQGRACSRSGPVQVGYLLVFVLHLNSSSIFYNYVTG